MADSKITALTAATESDIELTDVLPIVDDVATTPVTKKMTVENFRDMMVEKFAAKVATLTEATESDLATTDVLYIVDDVATTPVSKMVTVANFRDLMSKLLSREVSGTVAAPNSYYTNIRAQIPLFRADAALTITRIHIHGADTTPTAEMALDLKFADDLNTGGFANATVIDVCDTTNGVFTATSSFDDATVPSGKYVYLQLDAAPHVDWKDFYYEVYFTYD